MNAEFRGYSFDQSNILSPKLLDEFRYSSLLTVCIKNFMWNLILVRNGPILQQVQGKLY